MVAGGRSRRSSRWSKESLGTSTGPRAEDVERLEALLDSSQPRFGVAVVADAKICCGYRGERNVFRSRRDLVAQVLRLCAVTDSFFAQVCYRAKVECHLRRIPVLPSILHRLSVMSAQMSIGDKTIMGPGVYIPHGQVVIDGLTVVESGVVLRPFVTLGIKDRGLVGPALRRGAVVGTGAKVIGHVEVGERAEVGANAVVVHDVAPGATVVGVPASPLPSRMTARTAVGGDPS